MANQRTITDNMVKEGATIFVQGKVQYSRVASHISGEELIRDQQRKQLNGITPIDTPYTTISITDPRILPAKQGEISNEEKFVQERFYTKKNNPNQWCYTINSKSPYLPRIGQAHQDNPSMVSEIVPEGEMDTGLNVILVLRIYSNKKFGRKGISLDQIIVQEPIRYYSSGNAQAEMASRGITFIPMTDAERNQKIARNEANAQLHAKDAENREQAEMDMPAAAQVSAPNGNAFASNPNTIPQTAPNYTQPTAPTAPAAQQPANEWVCPTCNTTNPSHMKFCGTCGTQNPANNTGNVWANNTGINYNPNDNQY